MYKMSNQEMTVQEILGYKASTLSILSKQIEILQKAEQRILPKKADLDDAKAKDSVLTVEKSGELQEILTNEINKLEQFDVVLAVVGTMKAGKSTTINAIVGREILPNRNRPMTALPTLICHNPAKDIPSITIDPTVLNQFLSQLQAKLHLVPKSDKMHQDMHNLIDFIADGGQFNNYYEGEEHIFEFLYQLNDLVRLSKDVSNAQAEQGEKEILHFPFDEYKNFNNLPMIEVAFKLESDFETQGRFMLLDTAGPNEAGQDELKEALVEQLARSSAVMIVLDYTQLNSDAEKDVKDQIEKIPTVQKSRLFALVNKFDQKNANSDEADATCKHIFNNLLKDKIELDNIYAISAQDAYLANRMKAYIEEHGDKPEYQPKTWVEDFVNKRFGGDSEEYEEASDKTLEKRLNKLVEASRMAEPMQNVIVNMQRNAPFISIQSALAGAGYVFDRLHNVLNIKGVFAEKENLTEQQIAELQAKIFELQADTQSLQESRNEILSDIQQIQAKIDERVNLKDKIKSIRKETKLSIGELFDNQAEKDKEELEKEKEGKLDEIKNERKSFWKILGKIGLISENELEKRASILEEFKGKMQTNGNQLIFSKEQDLEDFKAKVFEMVNTFIELYIVTEFENILAESVNEAHNTTSKLNTKGEELLALLQEKFEKDGFDLRIEFDATANLDADVISIGNIDITVDERQHTKTYLQSGFFGKAKRGLGSLFNTTWGTYTESYETYTIYKGDMILQIVETIDDEFIEPFKEQVEEKIREVMTAVLNNIDDFSHKVDEITYEIQQSLEHQQTMAHLSKAEQEDEKRFISSLRQSHDDLDVDWQKLKEKFKVEDIKS